MKRLIVLFNLKEGVDVAEYEEWARKSDVATVKALGSVDEFTVHRASGLFGTGEASPYRYIEVIDVNDMDAFGEDLATETMRAVAAQYQAYADSPMFILTDQVA